MNTRVRKHNLRSLKNKMNVIVRMWGLLVVAHTLLVRQENKSHLLFDLCRWKIEEEDVEVVLRIIVSHHLCLTHRPLKRL